MHGQFSGGCHFESHEERQQSFSAPSFSPFQQEHQGCFREINNSRPEISINLPGFSINFGNGEQPCMPGGFERHIPGPPRFYNAPPQWGGGYQFGDPYAGNGGYNYGPEQYNPNYQDNSYNQPNGYYPGNGNYPYDNGNQNYANNQPVDSGINGGPNGPYNDNAAYQVPTDGQQLQPNAAVPQNGNAPDLSESTYSDQGTNAPHTNYGYGQDVPSTTTTQDAPPAAITTDATPAATATDAPPAAITTDATPAATATDATPAATTTDATPAATAPQGLDPASYFAMFDKIGSMPLSPSDFGTYLTVPPGIFGNTDQTATPAAPVDQTAAPAAPVDQTAAPAAPVDQTAAPAAPVDQTAAPAAPVDQTTAPATPIDQTPKAAPTDKSQTGNNSGIPDISGTSDSVNK